MLYCRHGAVIKDFINCHWGFINIGGVGKFVNGCRALQEISTCKPIVQYMLIPLAADPKECILAWNNFCFLRMPSLVFVHGPVKKKKRNVIWPYVLLNPSFLEKASADEHFCCSDLKMPGPCYELYVKIFLHINHHPDLHYKLQSFYTYTALSMPSIQSRNVMFW